jgi:hypothetical protein
MKLDKFPAVEGGWLAPHMNCMHKIYKAKGVNDLRVNVVARVAAGNSGCLYSFSRPTARRVFLSGAETLTLFGTMSDLKSHIRSGSIRSSWERVGEHLQRAIEQEARTIKRQDVSGRKGDPESLRKERETQAA